MLERTYLDHAATTPLRPEAVEAITRELTRVGNPSSLHTSGRDSRRVLEESRETVAACLGADPAEVIFTSGATEADNLVIKGTTAPEPVEGPPARPRRRVIISAIEHHAVLDSADALSGSAGVEVEQIGVDADGRIDLGQLRRSLEQPAGVGCVSIIWANNETGVLQPITDVVAITRAAGVTVHSDAVQAVGHLPVDFGASGLDALSATAHKIGGPVGVGCLLARRGLDLVPVQHGGGQERDVRSGTVDVAGAAGFAAALRVAVGELEQEAERLRRLRDRLIDGIGRLVDGTRLNGVADPARSLPGIANLSFDGCEADNLLMLLDRAGIDSSTGSACTAGVSQASHVLAAMGRTGAQTRSALRFSLGHSSTDTDVDRLLAVLPEAVERARVAGVLDS